MIQEPPHPPHHRQLQTGCTERTPVVMTKQATQPLLMKTETNLLKKSCMATNTIEKTPSSAPAATTVLKIPKQSTKPRIFLLTRPAKLPLVRKDTLQTVEAHRKELNLELPHLLEKKAKTEITKILRINQVNQHHQRQQGISQTTTEVVQIPQNQLQPMLKSYKSKSQGSLILHQEIIRKPQEQQQTKSQVTPLSVKYPTTTIQENNTVQAAYLKQNKSATVLIGKKPSSTLASMAGIELTGADMSPTAADMSGAMPPTATVEEINVPVFIDEYLQEAAISTLSATSGTSVTTQNIINNNNNSNNYNNHHNSNNNGNNCNHRKEQVNIDEINHQSSCFGVDTFNENFEFDIGLLTETTSKDQDKEKLLGQAYEQPQQLQETSLNLLFTPSKGTQGEEEEADNQQKQLQHLLDEILFGNNQRCINNNTTTNNSNNNTSIPMAVNDLADIFNNTTNNNNDEEIFFVAPNSQNLHYEDLDLDSYGLENAVDINDINDGGYNLLMDCGRIDNSQESDFNDPMFCSAAGPLLSSQSSQYMAGWPQELINAEPSIPHEYTLDTPATSSSAATDTDSTNSHSSQQHVVMDSMRMIVFYEDDLAAARSSMPHGNPLKRPQSSQTQKHMQEKRAKLRLDTKRRSVSAAVENEVLDTPGVVKLIDEFAMIPITKPEETSEDIYNDLIASSPQESCDTIVTVKSEVFDFDDYNSNGITPPYTPYSCNSNQTTFSGIFNILQPHSPATSEATTCTTNVTTKRGRGRPAKEHSDMPDLSQLARLPESEQKKLLERAKNNEASRKSRRKNKEREEAIEREERELIQRNALLNMECEHLQRIERKLRRALKRASQR
ncbi:xrp1 [Musca autumnalis]|uniref:xrp1 n=1 Tax=Musca autumnalis TaxID=221902 RepID=UPI003CF18A3A